jgi:hypothetical protein
MKKAMERSALCAAVAALTLHGGSYAQSFGDVAEGPAVVVAQPAEARFSYEQIQQMVAPVALYPDPLLAQTLMAATYPLEVAQAAQWRRSHPGLEAKALDDALADQPWDASVKTLVLFPDVLGRMAGDLAWTQDLGEAYLAQEGDVMAAVQDLRRRADEAGHLESTDQQVVRKTGATIVVEPADPAVIYVPSYNPAVVYGPGFATVTRTVYYPTVYRSYDATPSWVVFGSGVAAGALLTALIRWSDDDYYVVHRHHGPRPFHRHLWFAGPSYWSPQWVGPRYGAPGWRSYKPAYGHYGDVTIDRSRTVNIERNTVIENNLAVRPWEHAPAHRAGAAYRDPTLTRRYQRAGDALPAPAGARTDARGPRPDPGPSPRWSAAPGEGPRVQSEARRTPDASFHPRDSRQLPEERPAGGFGAPARERERVQQREASGTPAQQPSAPRWSRGPAGDATGPRRGPGLQAGEPGAVPAVPAARAEPTPALEQPRRYPRSTEIQQRAQPPPSETQRTGPFGSGSRPQSPAEPARAAPPTAAPRPWEARSEPQRRPAFQPAERAQPPPQRVQPPAQVQPQRVQPPPQALHRPMHAPERTQTMPPPRLERAQPPPRVQAQPQQREPRRRDQGQND